MSFRRTCDGLSISVRRNLIQATLAQMHGVQDFSSPQINALTAHRNDIIV